MRIFFVSPEFIDPKTNLLIAGGLANYLYKITAALRDAGNEIHVLIIGSVKKDIDYNGICLHFIKRRNIFGFKKYKKSLNPSALIVKHYLEKFNEKQKIDIVQYSSYLSLGQFPTESIASCVRISSYAKLHWQASGHENSEELFNEQEMFRASKFIFGPSNNTNAFIKQDLNLDRQIQTIETPFIKYDKQEDESVYQNNLAGKEYVLFFGTLWALKGSVEISEIIYEFLDANKKINFVFVGKQNKDKKNNTFPLDTILSNAKEHKDRIIYFDTQQHKTLYPIIRHAKAVVLPSRYDNFPNTCIEAMSLSKVVLATQDAGFDQLIKDNENGFLCRAYDSKSLLEGLNRIMKLSDEQLKQIGRNAYLRILDLTPEKVAKQTLDYYKFVIDNCNKGN
jgi:glycosyltransferase involved in cell wall biosynthesis